MPKRILKGTVIRKSGAKTVAVEVVRSVRDAKYGKSARRSKTYLVHDETDAVEVGQAVSIQEARRLSARKRFVIVPNSDKK